MNHPTCSTMSYPEEAYVFENNNGHILEATWFGINVLWGSACIWARHIDGSDDWVYQPGDLTPLTPAAFAMQAEAQRLR